MIPRVLMFVKRYAAHELGNSGAGFQPAAGASSPRSDRGQDARPNRLEASSPSSDRLLALLLVFQSAEVSHEGSVDC